MAEKTMLFEIDETLKNTLKSKLAADGFTFKQWVTMRIARYVDGYKPASKKKP